MRDTSFIRLAEYRLDSRMSILNERACISVEIDRLLRIEEHGLLRIHLEYEILEGTETDHSEQRILLLFRKIIDLSKLK